MEECGAEPFTLGKSFTNPPSFQREGMKCEGRPQGDKRGTDRAYRLESPWSFIGMPCQAEEAPPVLSPYWLFPIENFEGLQLL